MSLFTGQKTWTPTIEEVTGNGDTLNNLQKFTMGAGANRFEANIKDGLWLGGDTFATAKISMSFPGILKASDVVLTGGSISNISLGALAPGSAPSIQGWTSDLTFSATDHDTVAWTSGSIKLSDGTTFTISAGNTGNITAVNYVYLDTDTSETVLQTTTTATTAVGTNKILVAVAENVASGKKATFQAFGGKGGINPLIVADNIAANTITANEILANTITGTEIVGTTLSAITANLGTITAGIVTGVTIQTASIGRRVKMTTTEGIQWLNEDDEKGFMSVNSSNQMVIDADNGLFLKSNGVGDDIGLQAGDVIQLNCGESEEGQIQLLALDSGGSDIIMRAVDNASILESDTIQMVYNSDNDSSDAEWYSISNLRMKCNQDGDVTCDGSFTGGGADFAEMFESLDGKEIKAGTSVINEGDKIRPAKKGETPIGVISENPTIVGNIGGGDADSEWTGKYLKDDKGNYIMEKAEYWSCRKNKKTGVSKEKRKMKEIGSDLAGWSDEKTPMKGAKKTMKERRKVNPGWNKDQKCLSRKDRDEWNVVGLVGRVPILKGQPVSKNWIKLKELGKYNEYLIK